MKKKKIKTYLPNRRPLDMTFRTTYKLLSIDETN